VLSFNVGNVMDASSIGTDPDVFTKALSPMLETSQANTEMQGNITFHQKILSEDERISKMDLEYWVDYVYLFGVSDMIPLYDKVDPITFRNYDVYAILWGVLFLVLYIIYSVCSCISNCFKSKKKVE
jgi:hypothetical protein